MRGLLQSYTYIHQSSHLFLLSATTRITLFLAVSAVTNPYVHHDTYNAHVLLAFLLHSLSPSARYQRGHTGESKTLTRYLAISDSRLVADQTLRDPTPGEKSWRPINPMQEWLCWPCTIVVLLFLFVFGPLHAHQCIPRPTLPFPILKPNLGGTATHK